MHSAYCFQLYAVYIIESHIKIVDQAHFWVLERVHGHSDMTEHFIQLFKITFDIIKRWKKWNKFEWVHVTFFCFIQREKEAEEWYTYHSITLCYSIILTYILRNNHSISIDTCITHIICIHSRMHTNTTYPIYSKYSSNVLEHYSDRTQFIEMFVEFKMRSFWRPLYRHTYIICIVCVCRFTRPYDGHTLHNSNGINMRRWRIKKIQEFN